MTSYALAILEDREWNIDVFTKEQLHDIVERYAHLAYWFWYLTELEILHERIDKAYSDPDDRQALFNGMVEINWSDRFRNLPLKEQRAWMRCGAIGGVDPKDYNWFCQIIDEIEADYDQFIAGLKKRSKNLRKAWSQEMDESDRRIAKKHPKRYEDDGAGQTVQ